MTRTQTHKHTIIMQMYWYLFYVQRHASLHAYSERKRFSVCTNMHVHALSHRPVKIRTKYFPALLQAGWIIHHCKVQGTLGLQAGQCVSEELEIHACTQVHATVKYFNAHLRPNICFSNLTSLNRIKRMLEQ